MINIVSNDAEVANMLAGGAEGAKRNDIYHYVSMVNSVNISRVIVVVTTLYHFMLQ